MNIKHPKTNIRNLLNGKTRKRKRNLRKGTLVDATVQKNMRDLIPYK